MTDYTDHESDSFIDSELINDHTPGKDTGLQYQPEDYTSEAITREIKYLRRLESRYGSHGLRLIAITKLNRVLVSRGDKYV